LVALGLVLRLVRLALRPRLLQGLRQGFLLKVRLDFKVLLLVRRLRLICWVFRGQRLVLGLKRLCLLNKMRL
jgi:hypothetical protein